MNGEDLRNLPFIERKARLQVVLLPHDARSRLAITATSSAWEKRSINSPASGNLEGIVYKGRASLYDTKRPHWLKVKNPTYSQAEGRAESRSFFVYIT
jgi:ATP-dependent DNA ligase